MLPWTACLGLRWLITFFHFDSSWWHENTLLSSHILIIFRLNDQIQCFKESPSLKGWADKWLMTKDPSGTLLPSAGTPHHTDLEGFAPILLWSVLHRGAWFILVFCTLLCTRQMFQKWWCSAQLQWGFWWHNVFPVCPSSCCLILTPTTSGGFHWGWMACKRHDSWGMTSHHWLSPCNLRKCPLWGNMGIENLDRTGDDMGVGVRGGPLAGLLGWRQMLCWATWEVRGLHPPCSSHISSLSGGAEPVRKGSVLDLWGYCNRIP